MTPRKQFLFALSGAAILFLGVLLLLVPPYRAQTVTTVAGGCAMRVDVVEPASGSPRGYIVLLHGLAANKRVMWYLAQGFANQNLRIFIPDLPGHGRTPGPFTPERAESCAASLVNELVERRVILPERTILAGHSLGAAIAMRVAARVPVAGVLAISPAPMHAGHSLGKEMLPFRDAVPPPSHTLAMRGAWEPATVRQLDQEFLAPALDNTGKYKLVPAATHVSLLFNSEVARQDREWVSQILGISSPAAVPSQRPVYGAVLGVLGLSILTVLFLIRIFATRAPRVSLFPSLPHPSPFFALLQIGIVSIISVAILRFIVPLRSLRLFEGDYLASFFLLAGLGLLVWNWRNAKAALSLSWRPVLTALLAGLALLLLFSAWLDFGFYEAWLTAQRWFRFPVVFLAFLPWHLAEEFLLGPCGALSRWKRFAFAMAFRAFAWLAMIGGLFYLRSGEVLILLMAAYFAVFFVLQRLAVDVVHRESRSATAAAVFGAILFAGLALAIFPVA